MMGSSDQIYRVVIGKVRQNTPAYAVVDKETRLVRMDGRTKALAIFDTRAGARALAKLHKGATMVVPITMERVKRAPTV